MKVQLLVVQGHPQGKGLLFPCGEFVFGRGGECHIRPNSEWVSRQHCLLRVRADGVFLRDLGSTNGTLVNGKRLIGECALAHGDQLQIGPLVFEVCLEEAVPATVPVVPREGDTQMHCLDTTQTQALGREALAVEAAPSTAAAVSPRVPPSPKKPS